MIINAVVFLMQKTTAFVKKDFINKSYHLDFVKAIKKEDEDIG